MSDPGGRYVEVEGARIWWRAWGEADGPPLVLVHSLGLDSAMWQPQIEALWSSHRIVVMDLRGHGRSGVPAEPYSMKRLALDVLAVADAARLERFDLCGLSIGGQVAQLLTLEQPQRVRSLVLANTAARLGTPESWAERIAAVEAGGLAPLVPTLLGRWFSVGFEAREPQWFAYARERFLSTSSVGYAGCCAALASSDLRERVGQITVPTLVIGGSADVPTPPADAHWLHSAIAGSQLAIIEDAAHISNLDAEPEFTATVHRFYGSV